MIEEEWRDIPGYEGEYQISNFGRVKSLERYVRHNYGGLKKVTERILRLNEKHNGYYGVYLKGKVISVHRLVAAAFVSKEDESLDLVEHLDHNKKNNHFSNLIWSNQKRNVQRSVRDGIWNNQHTKK